MIYKFFKDLQELTLFILVLIGYFPVNMILAIIYGDKIDVLLSLFIPFYGLFVWLFN